MVVDFFVCAYTYPSTDPIYFSNYYYLTDAKWLC